MKYRECKLYFSLGIFCLSRFYIYFIFHGHLLRCFYYTRLINLFCTNSCFSFLLSFLITEVNVFEKTLTFTWLKARNKMSCITGRFLSSNTYIGYKNVLMKWGEPFYKKVACLRFLKEYVIFILQHFDWQLCILSKCNWMNNLLQLWHHNREKGLKMY